MKFIKFVTLILTTCSMSFAHYDIRIDMFQNHQTFEKANPDVIFAGYPGLKYRCYVEGGKLDSSACKGNYFQWMLNLKYDLDVAENQCNWLAKEMISKELLETIGGKYGLSEMDSRDDSKYANEIIEFQNMAALHASIAMEQMAVQRKTTEIMKKHIKLGESDIRKVYTEANEDNELGLDREFEEYLKQSSTDSDEFQINLSSLKYKENHTEDIRELAGVLVNPNLLKQIVLKIQEIHDFSATLESNKWYIKVDANKERLLYTQNVEKFIDENFDFKDKEFLRKIAVSYFTKIYDKIEHLLKYKNDLVKLKLRNCNGLDIFGNINVCSYNALLDLTRREKENEGFVSAGKMFDVSEIKNIVENSNLLNFAFRHADENGICLIKNLNVNKTILRPLFENEYWQLSNLWNNTIQLSNLICQCDKEIERVKFEYQISESENKKIILENLVSYKNTLIKQYYCLQTEIEEKVFKEYLLKNIDDANYPIDFVPTNDLSSRIRVQTSYQIFSASMNRNIRNNHFISSKIIDMLSIVKNSELRIPHICERCFLKVSQDMSEQYFIDEKNLTPLHLLIYKSCKDKLDSMYCGFGISVAFFLKFNQTTDEARTYEWPIKRFLNETTTKLSEEIFQDLPLNCFHITNPFSTIIGEAAFNNHSHLILQKTVNK